MVFLWFFGGEIMLTKLQRMHPGLRQLSIYENFLVVV